MAIDLEQQLENAIRDGIREGVKSKLSGYNSPIEQLIKSCIEKHNEEFRGMLEGAIVSCVTNEEFREEIAVATRRSLAKLLIQRFGGELGKQVNVLKSDPITRARITLAIEEIAKSQSH